MSQPQLQEVVLLPRLQPQLQQRGVMSQPQLQEVVLLPRLQGVMLRLQLRIAVPLQRNDVGRGLG